MIVSLLPYRQVFKQQPPLSVPHRVGFLSFCRIISIRRIIIINCITNSNNSNSTIITTSSSRISNTLRRVPNSIHLKTLRISPVESAAAASLLGEAKHRHRSRHPHRHPCCIIIRRRIQAIWSDSSWTYKGTLNRTMTAGVLWKSTPGSHLALDRIRCDCTSRRYRMTKCHT